jgi:hypothetical protein
MFITKMFYFFITVLEKINLCFTASLKGFNKERKCEQCYTARTFCNLFNFTLCACLDPETTVKHYTADKSPKSLKLIPEFVNINNCTLTIFWKITQCLILKIRDSNISSSFLQRAGSYQFVTS